MKHRNLITALILLPLIAALGIASRRYGGYLPMFVARYAGDTMWALAFYALFRILFPRFRLWATVLLTFAFSLAIELSQLWHPAWLETVRSTAIGGLLLGFGFRLGDLPCYAFGALFGWLIFHLANGRREPRAGGVAPET